MKKINIFSVIGIGLIIIVTGWVIYSGKISQFVPQKEVETFQENIEKEVILVIDDGEGSSKSFQSEFREGMTAFDLLEEKTKEIGLTLKIKTYDMGVFIEAIGDKENGEDGKYWLYYVNGEMPQVAADKQLLNPGDKVEFKFEKSSF
jgi:hypothetical protein